MLLLLIFVEVISNISLLAYHKTPSNDLKVQIESAKLELDNAYLTAKEGFLLDKIADLESFHANNSHHEALNVIKDFSDSGLNSSIQIKGGSSEERLENWLTHFKNLLGKKANLSSNYSLPLETVSNKLNIKTSAFSLQEIKTVIKSLNPRKAFGPDNIPSIIWKDQNFHSLLLKICNYCLENKSCPSVWRKSQIIPIPKKGDFTLVSNYRGISLLPIAAKIYNKLLLNRLLPFIDPLLRKNQNGFRPGRSTISQILSLRRIIEEMSLSNRDLVLVFIDFSKAFDSVDRSMMFKILKLYGIPDEIIDAKKVLYTNTSAIVLSPDGETEPFNILAGILQGDTLASFLFVIIVDYVLRVSVDKSQNKGIEIQPRRSSRYPAHHLTDTDFADDIALISSAIKNAQSLLISLEQAANSVGLHLNEKKTEYMNLSADKTSEIKTLSVSG